MTKMTLTDITSLENVTSSSACFLFPRVTAVSNTPHTFCNPLNELLLERVMPYSDLDQNL